MNMILKICAAADCGIEDMMIVSDEHNEENLLKRVTVTEAEVCYDNC